jgi:uncharacterized membrane protein
MGQVGGYMQLTIGIILIFIGIGLFRMTHEWKKEREGNAH